MLLLLLLSQNAGSNTISCNNQEGAAQNSRSTALAPLTDRGLCSCSTSYPVLGPTAAAPRCQFVVGEDQFNVYSHFKKTLKTIAFFSQENLDYLSKKLQWNLLGDPWRKQEFNWFLKSRTTLPHSRCPSFQSFEQRSVTSREL